MVPQKGKRISKKNEKIFLNTEGWSIHQVCCGKVLIGPNREVLIDPRFFAAHNGECLIKSMFCKKNAHDNNSKSQQSPQEPLQSDSPGVTAERDPVSDSLSSPSGNDEIKRPRKKRRSNGRQRA
ncbi:hypothetical protein RF11_07131 [Thelohanellus kitauei]|uniref:Uncharacterized protein n=1 Tax=Thelohanellus kitauei TaxID=669202 RepID=A0A0C2I8L2_THEKT|nr:hypothetical protein RF11_07131 [Thelohanellus kitauei]